MQTRRPGCRSTSARMMPPRRSTGAVHAISAEPSPAPASEPGGDERRHGRADRAKYNVALGARADKALQSKCAAAAGRPAPRMITGFVPKGAAVLRAGRVPGVSAAARTAEPYPTAQTSGRHPGACTRATRPKSASGSIAAAAPDGCSRSRTFWTMYDRELWAIGYPECQ